MEGILFEYDSNRQLSAFKSGCYKDVKRILICIGGLSNGFLSLPYYYKIAEMFLIEQNRDFGWCLVQVLLSSSYSQWGYSSLAKDCEEVDLLIDHLLKIHPNLLEICLLGHSTGSQDCVYFLKNGKHKQRICKVILQAGVFRYPGIDAISSFPLPESIKFFAIFRCSVKFLCGFDSEYSLSETPA